MIHDTDPVRVTSVTRGDLAGRIVDVVLAVAFGAVLAFAATGSDLKQPTELVEGCRNEQVFCSDKVLAPLTAPETREWQLLANDFVTLTYGPGKEAYPDVVWHPCFFTSRGGTCVAGLTDSPSLIHVSTAQPARTGPLVAHETLHAFYWKRFGDPDARHARPYAW